MRKYELVINELQSGIEKLKKDLPVQLQTILDSHRALDTVEHMEQTFQSQHYKQAFAPYRTDIRIKAQIHTISEFVRQIDALNVLVTRVGGVQTYDAMRRQIEMLYDAPAHKES